MTRVLGVAVLLLTVLLLFVSRGPGPPAAGPSASPAASAEPVAVVQPSRWGYKGPPMPADPVAASLELAGPPLRRALHADTFPGGRFMDVLYQPPYAWLTGESASLAGYRVQTSATGVRAVPLPSTLLPGRGYCIAVAGNGLLAVSDKLEGFVLIDVSDPDNPRSVGHVQEILAGCEGMAMQGGRLLVAMRSGAVASYDLGNPGQPRKAATLRGLRGPHDVAGGDGFACVADGPGGLATLRVEGDGRLRLLGRAKVAGDARRVVRTGDFAYVAMGAAGVDVVDVRDPRRPRVSAHLRATGPVFALSASDGTLYGAAWSDLCAWSLADPSRPRLIYARPAAPPAADGSQPLLTGVDASGGWVVASEWSGGRFARRDAAAALDDAFVERHPTTLGAGGQGSLAPAFTLRDREGKVHGSREYQGRYVLLAFFAPYSAESTLDFPDLERLWLKYRDRGLRVVGVATHSETQQMVDIWLKLHPVTFPVMFDDGRKTYDVFMDLAGDRHHAPFPRHVLIDPNGRVVAALSSYRPDALSAFLDKLPRRP